MLDEDIYDAVIKGPSCRLKDVVKVAWSIFGWMVHGATDHEVASTVNSL